MHVGKRTSSVGHGEQVQCLFLLAFLCPSHFALSPTSVCMCVWGGLSWSSG